MTLYVDDARTPHRGMKLSHLMADTASELEDEACLLGLRPEWKHRDHYDISESKRRWAVRKHGAVEITRREMVQIRRRHRGSS